MDDEDDEGDENTVEAPFVFPFKSGRVPTPSSTQTSDDASADAVKEAEDMRRDLRARTLAAAQTAGNENNLTLKVIL